MEHLRCVVERIAYAVKNVTVTDRNTMLKERIRELMVSGKTVT